MLEANIMVQSKIIHMYLYFNTSAVCSQIVLPVSSTCWRRSSPHAWMSPHSAPSKYYHTFAQTRAAKTRLLCRLCTWCVLAYSLGGWTLIICVQDTALLGASGGSGEVRISCLLVSTLCVLEFKKSIIHKVGCPGESGWRVSLCDWKVGMQIKTVQINIWFYCFRLRDTCMVSPTVGPQFMKSLTYSFVVMLPSPRSSEDSCCAILACHGEEKGFHKQWQKLATVIT